LVSNFRGRNFDIGVSVARVDVAAALADFVFMMHHEVTGMEWLKKMGISTQSSKPRVAAKKYF
jgi:hypothetical protein